ncbi:MAG: histidine kinase N-terminal 7TM domain-containing protein [Candidatus Paceibacterota bacterium]|jgi:hypothetical protein
MNYFWLYYLAASSVFNAIASAVCAFLIFFNNPRAKVNRLASLMAASTTVWAAAWAVQAFIGEKETALFWARILNFAVVFIPVLYLHWVLALLEVENVLKNKVILVLGWLSTFFFAFFAFTPYFVATVNPKPYFIFYSEPGILHPFFLALYGAMISYLVYACLKVFKSSDVYRKIQVKYILVSAILGFGGAATNYLIFYDIPVPPFGNPLVGMAFVSLTYSIVRYRFFDTKIILTEILLAIMGAAIAILPFLMSTLFLQILTGVIFLFFCFISYLLLQYTHRETQAKELLEKRVEERTKELDERNKELEKFYKLTIGRELKMAELKDKIRLMENK